MLSFITSYIGLWSEEWTRAMMLRRIIVLVFIVTLGALGPLYVAFPLFADRSTAVASAEQPCSYDAALQNPQGRYTPDPLPDPFVAGQGHSFELAIRNSGTCGWDSRVMLRREGGDIGEAQPAYSATTTSFIAPNTDLSVPIAFTASQEARIFDSTWRLYTPDGRSFGASFDVSIITHQADLAPAYPAPLLVDSGNFLRFFAFLTPAVIGFLIAIIHSGKFMREFYSLRDERRGIAHLLRLLFYWNPGLSATAHARAYEVDHENEAMGKIGGPASVSVHGGTAVLLERGGGFSRIEGPGEIDLKPFERVQAVIDLRTLSRPAHASARTKDGILVEADVSASFHLMMQLDDEDLSEYDELPVSREVIRRIVYEAGSPSGWESAASKAVASGVNGIISKKMFDELWAPDDPKQNPRREMFDAVSVKAKANLRKKGIKLIDMSIGALDIDEKIVEQRRELWKAYWESQSSITEAEGDAEANRKIEIAKAQAQAELIQTITQGLRMILETSSEQTASVVVPIVLSQIASATRFALSNPMTRSLVSSADLRAQDRLQQRILDYS